MGAIVAQSRWSRRAPTGDVGPRLKRVREQHSRKRSAHKKADLAVGFF